ncbi:hypothetical protein CLOM_g21613 [Closterium sp. NIES-68]|nr:hypothetical protein CLOM_g21613 [Closterium sp. NIES-68]GJP72941.1 hypothetical protein CLOP_g3709 [Closterium sp. NIES-67]
MAPCDASTSSSSGSNAFDTFLISFPNATSAPPPPLCAPTFPVSSVTFISTVAGFVTIILATGLIVYIFYKRGWFYQTDPDPEGAARLRALRESANIAKGLDPAVICSFPVYTFSDKSVKREVTTETNVLASLRQYSCEVSQTFSSSTRRISEEFSLSRCPTREENSSTGGRSARESACEVLVTIEGDDRFSLSGDDDAPRLPSVPSVTWTNVRECAVCLGEYTPGERIKVVPACAHGFHADCIDLWLAAKTTCPICRTDLKPQNLIAPTSPITQQEDHRAGVTVTDGGVTE